MKACLATFIILISLLPPIAAQIYDFDSLLQNDQVFKKKVKTLSEIHNLFDDDKIVRLTIISDFRNLVKRKFKGEYQPAKLKYHLNDTVVATREIKVKPRGNMRRQTCYFPPLMLNFPKKEAVLMQLRDFDKLKMVLDCKRGKMYEQYLLSEYYAYKIYNLITDYSFRVRLFELTLVDVNEKVKSMTSYAYIIENIDQLAERLDAISIETKNIRDAYTDHFTLAKGYLFQYLIGNTDWSIPALHNVKMIKLNDPTQPSPHFIPYDFDYAGIVNTTYAVPDEHLGIESVRERVYRGVCIEDNVIIDAAQSFMDNKEKVYQLYNASQLLDKHNLRSTIQYLDDFYEILESEVTFKKMVLEQCR